MMRECMAWLERVLSGGAGAQWGAVALDEAPAPLLRICFDGRSDDVVESGVEAFDLVVVPAVWHRRSELLASVAALLRQSRRRHGIRVELLVAHDAADRRLATQCDALIQGAGSRSELRVQRL